jgi:hypothetical protein
MRRPRGEESACATFVVAFVAARATGEAGAVSSLPSADAVTADPSLRESGLVIEFSLCLSRACLGKMFAFVYKWLKKTVFSYVLTQVCDGSSK